MRPLRPAAPVRPARRPRGRGRGGPPRPPFSPGRLLEIVAGVRDLVPHTGTPVPSCRGVGLVSRAGSPRQGALSAVAASGGGCAAGRPTPHTALVEESGSQRGSWGTHRRRAGGPGRAAGHGGVCCGCRQAPGAVLLAESPRAGRGSGTASCAITPWRKGAQSCQARARKARVGTHRPHHRARHHGVMQRRPVSMTPCTTLRPASTGRRRISTMMCDASSMVDLSGSYALFRKLPTSRTHVALHQTEPVPLAFCECGHNTRKRGKVLLQALMELLVREDPGSRHEPLAAMARERREP